jgi:hypothetical protein
MLQECGLRVTKLGRCPSVLMATSVVHLTSVNLAYALVALPGIGSSVSEASFPESPLRTRRICRLRRCKKLNQPDRGQDILKYRLARGGDRTGRSRSLLRRSSDPLFPIRPTWKSSAGKPTTNGSRCIDVLTKASFSLKKASACSPCVT